MKKWYLYFVFFAASPAFAANCMTVDKGEFKINIPKEALHVALTGNHKFFRLSFTLPVGRFESWAKECSWSPEPLHHGGQIVEKELASVWVDIVDTGQDGRVYIELPNSMAISATERQAVRVRERASGSGP